MGIIEYLAYIGDHRSTWVIIDVFDIYGWFHEYLGDNCIFGYVGDNWFKLIGR